MAPEKFENMIQILVDKDSRKDLRTLYNLFQQINKSIWITK
jgi:hypothetical protein